MEHESAAAPATEAPTASAPTRTPTRPRARSMVVGAANDPAEREADAVAVSVVSHLRRSFDDDRIRLASDGAPSKIAPISGGRSDVVPTADPSRPRIARSTTPHPPPPAEVGVLRRSPEPRVIRRYGGDVYSAKQYEPQDGDAYGVYGAESDEEVDDVEDVEAEGGEVEVEEAGPAPTVYDSPELGTVYDVVPELPSEAREPHVYDVVPDLEGDERGYSVPDLHDDPSQQTHEGHAMAHAVHAGAEPKPKRPKNKALNKAKKKYRGEVALGDFYQGEDVDPEKNHHFPEVQARLRAKLAAGGPAELVYKLGKAYGWEPSDVDKYLDAKEGVVKYLDETERARYEINIGGSLTQGPDERPFDTSGMTSYNSGSGFAAFVMSRGGDVYADQHKVGLFHHSSFLEGGAVACAGEIMVIGGKVTAITNKSGHYQTTPAMLVEMLQVLAAGGVALSGVTVYHRKLSRKREAGIPADTFNAASFDVPPYSLLPAD